MPINYNIAGMSEELDEFQMSLKAIDMESVKENTLRRVAGEMAEMVRQAVVAEEDIISPAMNGPNERGDGPSMASSNAWLVSKDGSEYVVRPHPSVRQRAVVLNFGYPGTITPNNSEVLKFTIEGEPVFVTEVQGPEYTGYWNAAFRRMRNTNKFEQIGAEELQKEFEEAT